MSAGDIVFKHVIESAKNLISKLRGRGRKGVRDGGTSPRGATSRKKDQACPRSNKKGHLFLVSFSHSSSIRSAAENASVSSKVDIFAQDLF